MLQNHLLNLLDKEKDRAKRRPHLMTHSRCEVLRVLVLLDILSKLYLVHPREDLFSDVAYENHSCVLTEVLLLLDFDFDEAIF